MSGWGQWIVLVDLKPWFIHDISLGGLRNGFCRKCII